MSPDGMPGDVKGEVAGGSLTEGGAGGDWLSRNLPGISGRFRVEREDFVVEELLAYEPCGEGTHHFLWVEKSGLSTFEVVKLLARRLGRKEREVGYAGLKDRNAVTRQWFSIEHLDERKLEGLEIPGCKLLKVRKHRNKIKLGHLQGNRFRLLLRGVCAGDLERARAILALCGRKGVPNFFGFQRFGRGGSTPVLGRLLLEGRLEEFMEALAGNPVARKAMALWKRGAKVEKALRALPRRFLSLCTAALQAQVFNDCLRARLSELDKVLEGDIAFLHQNGACFRVEDPAEARPRAACFEISPSGPLPGPRCLRPGGAPGALEDRVLAAHSLRHDSFAAPPGRFAPYAQQGTRRPLRVPLGDTHVSRGPASDQLLLVFRLPRGAYATAVLAELLRFPPDMGFRGEDPGS